MGLLEGRVAIVTAAAEAGIGQAIASSSMVRCTRFTLPLRGQRGRMRRWLASRSLSQGLTCWSNSGPLSV
jgi:hypothetical protein